MCVYVCVFQYIIQPIKQKATNIIETLVDVFRFWFQLVPLFYFILFFFTFSFLIYFLFVCVYVLFLSRNKNCLLSLLQNFCAFLCMRLCVCVIFISLWYSIHKNHSANSSLSSSYYAPFRSYHIYKHWKKIKKKLKHHHHHTHHQHQNHRHSVFNIQKIKNDCY